MKISIVTLAYNCMPYLKEAVESVLLNGYEDIEYIIIDPGSNDGGSEYLKTIKSEKVKVIYESDSGPSDGLNKGFNLATGEVFSFINGDDFYLSGVFEKVVEVFENKNIEMLMCAGYLKKDTISKYIKPLNVSAYQYLNGSRYIFQQGVFFSRKIWDQGHRFNINNKMFWDGEFFLEAIFAGARVKTLNKPVAVFRLLPTGITSSVHTGESYRIAKLKLFQRFLKREKNIFDLVYAFFDRFIVFFKKRIVN